jgi:hypothetical protein
MRELRGVIGIGGLSSEFKRQALLFDKLYSLYPINEASSHGEKGFFPANVQADIEFLESQGFLENITAQGVLDSRRDHGGAEEISEQRKILSYAESHGMPAEDALNPFADLMKRRRSLLDSSSPVGTHIRQLLNDNLIRQISADLNISKGLDTVPICRAELPTSISGGSAVGKVQTAHDVLHIALKALPVPDETSSWEDILSFKADVKDKLWTFRMWLHDMSSKPQTAGELGERLDYMVRQYEIAMEMHGLKSSQSFLDVFVIAPLEIIEDLVKLNWSKIAKGALSVKKRKLELLEAEMKAPGREVAYVYDAQKRFGPR